MLPLSGAPQRNGYPYALWNRDESPTVTMRNTYSHWPFILVVEAGGRRPALLSTLPAEPA